MLVALLLAAAVATAPSLAQPAMESDIAPAHALSKRATTCFLVKNSRLAPAYNGLAALQSTAFKDTATLDKFLQDYLYNSSAANAAFGNIYGCPGFAGANLRFMIAIRSAYHLNSSRVACAGTAGAVQVPQLCKDTCNIAVASLKAAFEDPNSCLQSPSAANTKSRQATTNSFVGFCNSLNVTNTAVGSCLDGNTDITGVNTCGFANVVFAQDYCQNKNPSDPCCKNVALDSGSESLKLPSPQAQPTTFINDTTSKTGSTAESQQKSSETGSSATIFVSIGVTVLVATVAVGAVLALIRYNRHLKNKISLMSGPKKPLDAKGPFILTSPTQNKPILSPFSSQPNTSMSTGVMLPPYVQKHHDDKIMSIYMPNNPSLKILSPMPQPSPSANPAKRISSMILAADPSNPNTNANHASGSAEPGPTTADGVRVAVGDTLITRIPYTSNFEDEMSIDIGQKILVNEVFEDGWALGKCIETGTTGMFPVEFTVHVKAV